jgi:hypothetical protein
MAYKKILAIGIPTDSISYRLNKVKLQMRYQEMTANADGSLQ